MATATTFEAQIPHRESAEIPTSIASSRDEDHQGKDKSATYSNVKQREATQRSQTKATMGNIFCPPHHEENARSGAFQTASDADKLTAHKDNGQLARADGTAKDPNPLLVSNADAERMKKLQAEQTRLETIVGTANRHMVSIRSTRGGNAYHDQGFAAALAQHLEQTTQFPDEIDVRLPPPTADAKACLMRPQWEGILLGEEGEGLAGCGDETPVQRMDRIAEALFETSLPANMQLFNGAGAMLETL